MVRALNQNMKLYVSRWVSWELANAAPKHDKPCNLLAYLPKLPAPSRTPAQEHTGRQVKVVDHLCAAHMPGGRTIDHHARLLMQWMQRRMQQGCKGAAAVSCHGAQPHLNYVVETSRT
jgi:hypothetical protein